MKTLVGIPCYGNQHDVYLARVLEEYRTWPDTDAVVFSDRPRPGIYPKVVVYDLGNDPVSLTHKHRRYFADRVDDYDLFLYAEDDVLVTRRNLEYFIAHNENLGDWQFGGAVPGFFLVERRDDILNYPQYHAEFHWEPQAVYKIQHRGLFCTMAYFTNVHSATCLLTRNQIRLAIRDGNYLREPHLIGRYGKHETNCSGPYLDVCVRKLICLDHFDDALVEHLPGNYIGRLGVSDEVVRADIERLKGEI